jgi:hypothetical protein
MQTWKNWVQLEHVKNVRAADIPSAVYLAGFLRTIAQNRRYADYLEIADLQRYKMIKNARKVRAALATRGGEPFVFVLCKN